MDAKYRSRKFIITLLVGIATTVLAYFGKMDAHVALTFSSMIVSYNVVNGMLARQ